MMLELGTAIIDGLRLLAALSTVYNTFNAVDLLTVTDLIENLEYYLSNFIIMKMPTYFLKDFILAQEGQLVKEYSLPLKILH